VPEHLQGWIDPGPAQPVPAPAPIPASRIVIPSIDVDAPVTEGTDWESLKYRVGHHPGTTNPGQRGNMVLAAHNDVYGEIFRYLPDVPLGEIVTVYAGEQVYRYRITGRRIILPNQVEVMAPTTGPTLTLISCYPYLIDTHRIVLFAELIG
jgi:sortase A